MAKKRGPKRRLWFDKLTMSGPIFDKLTMSGPLSDKLSEGSARGRRLRASKE